MLSLIFPSFSTLGSSELICLPSNEWWIIVTTKSVDFVTL